MNLFLIILVFIPIDSQIVQISRAVTVLTSNVFPNEQKERAGQTLIAEIRTLYQELSTCNSVADTPTPADNLINFDYLFELINMILLVLIGCGVGGTAAWRKWRKPEPATTSPLPTPHICRPAAPTTLVIPPYRGRRLSLPEVHVTSA
jgi:hypothetical protein